ncbi:MAG: OsmC family protein [Candidatus Angelobacter sp.]
MNPLPHHYSATAFANVEGDVAIEAPRLPRLVSAPPAEFGGPGNQWSPETLLVAAVADCFLLTFRAIAAVSRLQWISLTCEVVGTLDKVDRVMQFTGFMIRPRLLLPSEANQEQALRLLARTEQACLVTSSLKSACQLEPSVEIAPSEQALVG